jgi:excisionase family DNA binding protein
LARAHIETARKRGAGYGIETVKYPRFKPSTSDEILDSKQAADYLQVHTKTVIEYARKGIIPARKLGANWRFLKSALREWLSEVPTT